MKIGVLLDKPKILAGFDYTFYEVKPSSGRILNSLPNAWNVVNCFADNTTSQSRPDLIATYAGNKAVRGTTQRFLWDWICPSKDEYREYCKRVIRDIAQGNIAGIRLDSVCFPREGYCDCSVCSEKISKCGDAVEARVRVIESFIHDVRTSVDCQLGLTVEPDPWFSNERFGIDINRVSKDVDFISTPLYMDYSIVYWLDLIAYAFRRKIEKPFFIELYAGHPRQPTKYLVSALAVASKYADCIVLSTYEAHIAEELQHELAKPEFKEYFKQRDCSSMLEVIDGWKKLR